MSPAWETSQPRHAEFSRLHKRSRRGTFYLWFTGTAAIIAGSGHFCLPFLEDKIRFGKSQARDLAGVAGLEILDYLERAGPG